MKSAKLLLGILCAPLFFVDANWLPPVDLTTNGTSASNPEISLNDSNKALTIWASFDLSDYTIQTSYFNEIHWSNPPIDLSSFAQFISGTQIALNKNNQGIALWQGFSELNQYIIQAANFNGATWSSPTNLSSENSYSPSLSMNDSNHAIGVWRNDQTSIIQSAYFNGSSWSSPVSLSSLSQHSYSPSVSMNSLNQAIAVWENFNGSKFIIQAAYFNGSTWSSPVNLSSLLQDSYSPSISINELNHAIAIWQISDGSNGMVQAAYFNGSTWSSPVNLSSPQQSLNSPAPSISMNSLNQAIGLWENSNGSNNIIQAAYFNGSAWSSPVDLSYSLQDSYSPSVSMNELNHAIAIWQISDGSNGIIQATYFDASNWSSPVNLSSQLQDSYSPSISMNELNHAIAAWKTLSNNNYIIQAAYFEPPPPNILPPETISGSKKINEFLFQKAYYNQIAWSKSPSPSAASYHIYREGSLIGTVLATSPLFFIDHTISLNLPYTYQVTSVTILGEESSPITIVVD